MGMNVNTETDILGDGGLFEMKADPSFFLRDRYQEPPFTVLDRRGGSWQDRDRKWKALGIQSEVGREAGLTFNIAQKGSNQTSVFSPTLAELMYRWYSKPGACVLDPFAGGSVRGVVASALQQNYVGIELRAEQVEANRAQGNLGGGPVPQWVHGDSAAVLRSWMPDNAGTADFVLSCPPYAYLEKYSDDPADLSNMKYPDFLEVYRGIIKHTAEALRPDRFAAWIVGEVREKGGDGSCVGLVPDTVQAFRDAGMDLYNDHIILTPIGTAAVRTPIQFDASRKAGRIHEYAFVFVKGDAKRATKWLEERGEESSE
jgi:DNA modification methylase